MKDDVGGGDMFRPLKSLVLRVDVLMPGLTVNRAVE